MRLVSVVYGEWGSVQLLSVVHDDWGSVRLVSVVHDDWGSVRLVFMVHERLGLGQTYVLGKWYLLTGVDGLGDYLR